MLPCILTLRLFWLSQWHIFMDVTKRILDYSLKMGFKRKENCTTYVKFLRKLHLAGVKVDLNVVVE